MKSAIGGIVSRMRWMGRSIVCHGARFVLFVWFNNIRHLLIGIITVHIGWRGLRVHIPGHILVRSMRRLIGSRRHVKVPVMITILMISPLIIRLRCSIHSIHSVPAIHPADGSTDSTIHIRYVLLWKRSLTISAVVSVRHHGISIVVWPIWCTWRTWRWWELSLLLVIRVLRGIAI